MAVFWVVIGDGGWFWIFWLGVEDGRYIFKYKKLKRKYLFSSMHFSCICLNM